MDIGIKSTRIKTHDDILITVPNSILVNSKIINESAPTTRTRLRLPVNVAYGSDIGLGEDILLDIMEGNPDILKEPEPKVLFMSFGESALNFEIFCWIEDPALRFKVTDAINREIYRRFKEAGIVIPFPQMDVHIKEKD